MEIETPRTPGGRGQLPALTAFTDYREYLRALYGARKKSNLRFSFRGFSAWVGFKSPNYLQMILAGERNLSVETADEIATRLKLTAAERAYFVALVMRAGARSEVERREAERARLIALKKIVSRDIPAAKKEIFVHWQHLLVRELFLLKDAIGTPDWIVEKLGHCLTREEACHSLEVLLKSGFLRDNGGRLVVAEPVLDTDDTQMATAMMRRFHSELLRAWSTKLEELPLSSQELGVLNIPISASRVPELRRRIRAFQDEIIGWVQNDAEADRVVQLGTYLIGFED